MSDFHNHRRHRQSTRLRGYDYTSPGAYFVTICTAHRQPLFGDILEGEMVLNDFGQIVLDEWYRTEELHSYVELDAFVVMPNHVHGIIWIRPNVGVGAQRAAPLHGDEASLGPRPSVAAGSLGAVVRAFKSAVSKRINESRGTPGMAVWQRNFHDRITRIEQELERTRTYILENPLAWPLDENNPMRENPAA